MKRFLIFIFIIVLAVIVFFTFFHKKRTEVSHLPGNDGVTVVEPQFKKEGVLTFLSAEKDTIKTIDIEVADNMDEQMQGLMYRSSMSYSHGMLFIFDEEEEQSFWMKNTKISLDIIYVNSNREIVTIYKHTQPYSESPIPSHKPAMYVVETTAGFCDKFGVKEGDSINFTRINIPA